MAPYRRAKSHCSTMNPLPLYSEPCQKCLCSMLHIFHRSQTTDSCLASKWKSNDSTISLCHLQFQDHDAWWGLGSFILPSYLIFDQQRSIEEEDPARIEQASTHQRSLNRHFWEYSRLHSEAQSTWPIHTSILRRTSVSGQFGSSSISLWFH